MALTNVLNLISFPRHYNLDIAVCNGTKAYNNISLSIQFDPVQSKKPINLISFDESDQSHSSMTDKTEEPGGKYGD